MLLSATTALAVAVSLPLASGRADAATSDIASAQDVAIGSSVAQTVYLALRKPAAAEAYARAVQTPGAQFHKFLTVDQFVSAYAPTDADIAKVEAALVQLGYTIGTVFPNHLGIQVTSTAGTAEAALGVTLKRMTVQGRTGMVPVGAVTLPSSIRGLVRGIGGLNTLRLPRSHMAVAAFDHASTARPATGTLTGGTPGNYLPQDFAKRYGVTPIYANGINGKGATIGIVTLANYYTSDPFLFWKEAGLTVDPNRLTTVDVDGGTEVAVSDAAGEGETDLDIEQSGGLATGANIRVYVAPNNTNANFIDGFEAAASENIADTVSTSWGQPELDFFAEPSQGIASSTYLMDAFHDVFLEMGIQGQSIYVAAGDSGSFDTVRSCSNYGTPTAKTPVCNAPYAVDSPSNDPAVTAAGGTTVPFTYTSASGRVYSVTQEQAWSWRYLYTEAAAEGKPLPIEDVFSTGDGGGVSSYFKLPYYQQGVSGITRTVPGQSFTEDTGSGPVTLVALPSNFAGRNMPDISADADPESGYVLIEDGEVEADYGGTSFVAPQLNGVTALAVQGAGGRVGLLNNIAYGVGTQGSDDIAAGDNWGYNAVAGYDNAAGIGVLNATKLANVLLTLKGLYGK